MKKILLIVIGFAALLLSGCTSTGIGVSEVNITNNVYVNVTECVNCTMMGNFSNPLRLPDMDSPNAPQDWACIKDVTENTMYFRSGDLYICVSGSELKVSAS